MNAAELIACPRCAVWNAEARFDHLSEGVIECPECRFPFAPCEAIRGNPLAPTAPIAWRKRGKRGSAVGDQTLVHRRASDGDAYTLCGVRIPPPGEAVFTADDARGECPKCRRIGEERAERARKEAAAAVAR